MIIAYFKAQIERVYIDVPIIIMVFFTCNACGQCVKKIHVEKHYLRECRNCEVLSCMDCGKDFFGDDYKLHTKCISENEKYGGKDYVASSKANKGEVKQSQWIECVQAASSSQSLGPRVKGLLERLANYDNIPRKKVKFERFLQNGLNVRDAKLIEQIWTVFSEAGAKQKNTLAAKAEEGTRQETEKTTQENGTSSGEQSSQGDTKADLKKTKKDKSHKERASDGGGDIVQDDGESTKSDKKKKKKKKMEEENIEAEESDEERPCRDDAAKKSSKKRKHKKHHDQPEQVTLNGEEEEDGKAADEESGDAKKKKKHKHKKHGDESTHNGLRETTDATEETENGDSEPLKKRKGKKHRRTESQTLECEEKDAGIMKSVETEDSHDETVSKKSKKKKHKIDEAEGELLKSELKRMIADDGALDLGSPKKKSKNKMDRVKEKSADHKKKKRKAADDSDGELKNLEGDDESEKRTSGGEKKKKKGAKDKKKDFVNMDDLSLVDDNSVRMNTDAVTLCASETKTKKKRKQKGVLSEA